MELRIWVTSLKSEPVVCWSVQRYAKTSYELLVSIVPSNLHHENSFSALNEIFRCFRCFLLPQTETNVSQIFKNFPSLLNSGSVPITVARTGAAQQMPRPSQLDPLPPQSSSEGLTGTGDEISDYGDHSSSYWPEGWDFERYRSSDTEDLLALPEEELEKLQGGFRDVLGEAGVSKLAELVFQGWSEEQKACGNNIAAADTAARTNSEEASASSLIPDIDALAPNWLKTYEKYFKEQEWGFVAFKTCSYDDNGRMERVQGQVRRDCTIIIPSS